MIVIESSMNLISGEEVWFDENGDGPARYDILNLQGNADDIDHHLHYVQVGTWSTGKLTLNTSAIRFFSDQRPFEEINVRRFCSEACQNGHVKVNLFEQFHCYLLLKIFYRNIQTTNDAVGNVIHVVMLLYLMKQHVSLVHLVSLPMKIKPLVVFFR